MTKIINVIGSDEKKSVAYARNLHPKADIHYVNTLEDWVTLSKNEKEDVLFADTEWYKKKKGLATAVTSFFKHKPEVSHTRKHYTDPHTLLRHLLPTEVKDMRIVEAHADFTPGEPPFLILKVLMEDKR